jgi:protein-S-isoprenylcysteine O-methyltransferase Ste14
MNEAKTPVPHGAGIAQKIVQTGPFSVFRHPIYIGK